MSRDLTHFDAEGRAHMVDVSDKPATARVAMAEGSRDDGARHAGSCYRRNRDKKGDVLAVAELAGIQAAKKTADLIPLCHPLAAIESGALVLEPDTCPSRASALWRRSRRPGPTGVEMEALTAVSAAALTVYDMLKAVDRSMDHWRHSGPSERRRKIRPLRGRIA